MTIDKNFSESVDPDLILSPGNHFGEETIFFANSLLMA